jgi:hypothetical protein
VLVNRSQGGNRLDEVFEHCRHDDRIEQVIILQTVRPLYVVTPDGYRGIALKQGRQCFCPNARELHADHPSE